MPPLKEEVANEQNFDKIKEVEKDSKTMFDSLSNRLNKLEDSIFKIQNTL